ncbi:MAG: hypothetical protein A2Y12_15590 [Planctomycetes bacterium GWF2_42_9]|nr:MAG: hypothetical protein A2Y12_15590 [Planctomycetes bacterium GWF2_42_9]
MENSAGVLEVPTIQEKTYEHLRRMIVCGELSAGSRIKESVLAHKLGASRVPIRESLIRLRSEGLVVCRPRFGYTVKKYSRKDVVELYELRGAIEGLAVRLASERATDVEIAKCEEIHREFEATLDRFLAMSDGTEEKTELNNQLASLDERFHRSLLRISDNSRVEGLFAILHDEKICLSLAAVRNYTNNFGEAHILKETLQSHNDVLLAIKCRDAESAEKEMRRHIKMALKTIMAEFEKMR